MRLEILFSRREDVILSDLDFEIENRAGRSIRFSKKLGSEQTKKLGNLVDAKE